LFKSGRLEEAAAVVLDAVAMGQELGGIRLEGAALNSAEALFRLGRLEEADALLSGRGRLPTTCVNHFELLAPWMAVRRGRFQQARRALAAADEMTAGQADVQLRGWYHMINAELALEEHNYRTASDEVDSALSLAAASEDEFYGPEMCALGVRALADAHEDVRARRSSSQNGAEKARLVAAGLAQEADRLVAAPAARGGICAPQPRAFALQCRAEESRLHGSNPVLWEAAAEAWEEQKQPYHVAYCRWREAASLMTAPGERRRATELLGHAWRTSKDIGAVPLQTSIERLAQRARISLIADDTYTANGSPVASDLGLTAREVEVLGQLAAGRTDAQIAEQLFISKKTASVHVSNLLRKLSVTNRHEAGEIGQSVGLG
jgi:DNA-binding CsgD family transcriptional regulator